MVFGIWGWDIGCDCGALLDIFPAVVILECLIVFSAVCASVLFLLSFCILIAVSLALLTPELLRRSIDLVRLSIGPTAPGHCDCAVTTAPEGQYSFACADNVTVNSHIDIAADINPEAVKSALIRGFALYSFCSIYPNDPLRINFEVVAAIAVSGNET